jgi:hypothetical protein
MTSRSRRLLALLFTLGAVGVAAAAPASSQAAIQKLPPACFESPQFAICSDEVVPFVLYAADHPIAAARFLVGTTVYVVCYGHEDVCSID